MSIAVKQKKIDPAREYQIYKEACSLSANYNMALRAVDLRVMGEILSYLNHESFSAYPGINKLLSTLPISRRTLLRSLKKLESEGHIRRRRRWNRAKGKSDSTVYVPLIPNTVMPTLRIRFAGQPVALTVLARVGGSGEEMTHDPASRPETQDEQVSDLTPGSGEEMTPGSGEEMTPEPLTEPLTEPLSSTGCDEGITPVEERLKEEEGGRGRQEVREDENGLAPSDNPLPLVSETPEFHAATWKACFRFAREEFPDEDGEKHVGGAWKRGYAVEDVWNKLTEAKETGESLGRIFWQPGE